MPRKNYKKKTAKAIAVEALKMAKKCERKAEVKIHDQAYNTGVNNVGVAVELATGSVRNIPIGTNYNNRIGDQVFLKSIDAMININWNATPTTQQMRVMLVRGHVEDNVPCDYSDALQTNDILSRRTYHDIKKVTVLSDRVFTLNRDTGVASNKYHFRIKRKLGWKLNYQAVSTNPENGGLYLYLISDQSADVPVIDVVYRIHYTDE